MCRTLEAPWEAKLPNQSKPGKLVNHPGSNPSYSGGVIYKSDIRILDQILSGGFHAFPNQAAKQVSSGFPLQLRGCVFVVGLGSLCYFLIVEASLMNLQLGGGGISDIPRRKGHFAGLKKAPPPHNAPWRSFQTYFSLEGKTPSLAPWETLRARFIPGSACSRHLRRQPMAVCPIGHFSRGST